MQSRDPFSGDCDVGPGVDQEVRRVVDLQSRDPFSGDCDAVYCVPTGPPGHAHLAEPRPVLRGLRRRKNSQSVANRLPRLAEPRPVLRGLRRVAPDQQGQGRVHRLAEPRPVLRGLRLQAIACSGGGPETPPPCRAETRSQGIATVFHDPRIPAGPGRLAEPRPVLRGLRPGRVGRSNPVIPIAPLAEPRPVLRGLRRSGPGADPGSAAAGLAEPRPVLRGLRPVKQASESLNKLLACRAETRSQGIATLFRPLRHLPHPAKTLAEPRPVLRGLRRGARPRAACPLKVGHLQSRDPFSGDCDPRWGWTRTAGPRRASLQSRDPFSGDCDARPMM